ncbi:protein SCO1/2 [Peribacillus deserti]|uniref:Protein SCO1/2 n=1 Tax=Peribacillus deserti TaxID=673318 RepID=A0ABS2QLY3_9BACI|nr:SCO family protein [Peribacillus deserti]MBM7694020.1 protein SCO1/2 [Peribacillus deserti]
MKIVYILLCCLVCTGAFLGVYSFFDYKQSKMNFPENIVMKTPSGVPFSFNTMKPKVRLLEFMYTRCPDICPSTTFQMQKVKDRLIKEKAFGNKVEFLTVTIDPDRDTDEVLKHYAMTFDIKETEGWKLLRGNKSGTKKLAEEFNFTFRDSGTGMLTHTSTVYLLNEENKVIEEFGMGAKSFSQDWVFERIMDEI